MADLSEYRNNLLRTGKRPSGRSPEAIPRERSTQLSNMPAGFHAEMERRQATPVFNLVDGEGL
jgi:hypothetical protein